MLVCGMWFGSDKPVMSTYMQPITDELKLLSTTGFNWISPIQQTNTNSRVFLVAATCDAVAHPMIRNCIQFNGKYGCWKCYDTGERVEKGNGHVNCYPFSIPKPQLRTHEGHMQDCILAQQQHTAHRGVKGPSPVMLLPKFDVVTGFISGNLIVIMFSLYMLHVLLFILTCTLFCSLHFTSLTLTSMHSTELYTMYCYYNLCRVYTSYYIPRYLSVKPFFSINIMHTVVEINTVMKLNDR